MLYPIYEDFSLDIVFSFHTISPKLLLLSWLHKGRPWRKNIFTTQNILETSSVKYGQNREFHRWSWQKSAVFPKVIWERLKPEPPTSVWTFSFQSVTALIFLLNTSSPILQSFRNHMIRAERSCRDWIHISSSNFFKYWNVSFIVKRGNDLWKIYQRLTIFCWDNASNSVV